MQKENKSIFMTCIYIEVKIFSATYVKCIDAYKYDEEGTNRL